MVVWGDELGRTQNGNNNPYNIDSVATWNNYAMIATSHPNAIPTGYGSTYHDNFGKATNPDGRNPLFCFAAYVARLRQNHVALRQRKYGDWLMDSGEDVTYQFKKEDGQTDLENGNRCIWLRIDGSGVGDRDFLLFINMHSKPVSYQIPSFGGQWRRLIDTATWAEPEYNCWTLEKAAVVAGEYEAHPFSVVVLTEVLPM